MGAFQKFRENAKEWLDKVAKAGEEVPEEDYNRYGYEEDDEEIIGIPDYGDGEPASATASAKETSEKISVKLMQPKSHAEAPDAANYLSSGCIVVLDIGELQKADAEGVFRLTDFLSGVVYALRGQMVRTNKTTIVLAPGGVDISGLTGGN